MATDDMPPGILLPPSGRGPPGFIPPPPGAFHESPAGRVFNPFPGYPQAGPPPPPFSAPVWPTQLPPWATNVPSPRSRYWSPNPDPSYSFYVPPAQPPHLAPAGGGMGGGMGEPIVPTPWFSGGGGGGLHPPGSPWAAGDTGPERRRHASWGGAVPMEQLHTPATGFEIGFGGAGAGGAGAGAGFRTESPLRRTLSAGAAGRTRTRHRNKQRPRQVYRDGPTWFIAGDLGAEEYDADNLARRPRDWRPDYESRRWFPRIPRSRSDVEDFKDTEKRIIQGTLAYISANPCVKYDFRYFPNPASLIFPHLGRNWNHIDFAQLATNPPVERMRLFHPLLPWYIDVHSQLDNGVTVGDVFMQMHMELQCPITTRHYFNEDLGSAVRERIAQAFEIRTAGKEEERKKGIRKVDFLEDKVFFVGLVRAKDGLWEMKTE